jgi:hypothetical protein
MQTEATNTTNESADIDYEQLYMLLYAYRFGTISFLELIEQFEQVLGIRVLDKAELVNDQVVITERKDN